MVRGIILAVLMAVLPVFSAEEIVVLTETPVAEFTLPDGSVLKNAFVFRRSAEGLMVVHDDGQYFLNFKLLPDEWRMAYGVSQDLERADVSSGKRFDQYLVFPVLERIEGLPHPTVAFLESERYDGSADGLLLAACALQSLLDGKLDKAVRLQAILDERFPAAGVQRIESFYAACETCGGKGTYTNACPECGGTGTCPRCAGVGERKTDMSDDKTIHCTTCRGTGKCQKCQGTGKLVFQCIPCKGRGKALGYDAVRSELKLLADRLHTQCEALKATR